MRRSRARRSDAQERTLPSDVQRLANLAGCYVREYLRRGAIAPPDACDRCELEVQVSPSRPFRMLRFWHPDPAQPQLVAWLCRDCRRIVRATGEAVALHWTWPGLVVPRSRKPPDLSAAATALPRVPRDAAFVHALMAALSAGEHERTYAVGSLAGPRWQPTEDPQLDALLRAWVFLERTERGRRARAAGGQRITPLAPQPRRVRGLAVTPPPEKTARALYDDQASRAAIVRALERLEAAEAGAAATIARVEEALGIRSRDR